MAWSQYLGSGDSWGTLLSVTPGSVQKTCHSPSALFLPSSLAGYSLGPTPFSGPDLLPTLVSRPWGGRPALFWIPVRLLVALAPRLAPSLGLELTHSVISSDNVFSSYNETDRFQKAVLRPLLFWAVEGWLQPPAPGLTHLTIDSFFTYCFRNEGPPSFLLPIPHSVKGPVIFCIQTASVSTHPWVCSCVLLEWN